MDIYGQKIYNIYLELKKGELDSLLQNKNIQNIVIEIQKNRYTDVQYFVLAKLLYYLINFKNIKAIDLFYSLKNRYNKSKVDSFFWILSTNKKLNTNSINENIKSIINELEKKEVNNNKMKKIDIILRFIDEYLEVSKENSKLAKKISCILQIEDNSH